MSDEAFHLLIAAILALIVFIMIWNAPKRDKDGEIIMSASEIANQGFEMVPLPSTVASDALMIYLTKRSLWK